MTNVTEVNVSTNVEKKSVDVSLKGDRRKLLVDVPGMTSIASIYNPVKTTTNFDTAKGISTFTVICKTEEDMENLKNDLKVFFFQK